ncbi:hypothetical protein HY251_19445, partial [bacterium]|nr:hypothetical protein [bacterium]
FRGLAQLVPGMPAGPNVPGTTDKRLNGTYYIHDEHTPPDIHHEKGLACIDCHTSRETMGDGNIYGYMEHGTETTCESCHGAPDAYATMKTRRGVLLSNVKRDGDRFFLTGKLDGKRHELVQAKDVVTKGHPRYNERAARAMTKDHGRVACYSCHSAWNTDFFGFHLDRHEGFTMLDTISGRRTPGRVTTLEKVFASFRQLTLGWDSQGRVSPYIVGFSTMCTFHDKDGKTVLDQQMPETAAGLSGMTMIHHQVHTVRSRARECADCHRSPQALGLGSASFRLARTTLFAASQRGLEVVSLDRKNLAQSAPQEGFAAGAPAASVSVLEDPVQGHARWIAVGLPDSVVVLDGRASPPREVERVKIGDAEAFAWLGRRHLVVVSPRSLAVVRLPERSGEKHRVMGTLPLASARDVKLSFRTAFVTDAEDGLVVIDLDDLEKPKVVTKLSLRGDAKDLSIPRKLALAFQQSRFRSPGSGGGVTGDPPRTRARALAFVTCGKGGFKIVDVTEPSQPVLLGTHKEDGLAADEVAFSSVFDLGSAGGGLPSRERDYLYVIAHQDGGQADLRVIDVDDPKEPEQVGRIGLGGGHRGLVLAHVYNAPFLQHYAIVGSPEGAQAIDVTRRGQPTIAATITGTPLEAAKGGNPAKPVSFADLALETMPLDRMVDEDGLSLKDISHPKARYLSLEEMRRVLSVPLPEGGKK